MMEYISEVQGVGFISAKVVADSISEGGVRITTFELEYPRFIHGEFMTHRVFSRNAASSRAIPVKKVLEGVRELPAMPIHWGANQPGMQADKELSEKVVLGMFRQKGSDVESFNLATSPQTAWAIAAEQAANIAEAFSDAGYHKQIVNRITECYQFIKVVMTSTEIENFFHLRLDKTAQPEIRELANVMRGARMLSRPKLLLQGEWHLPYVETVRGEGGVVSYYVHGVEVSKEDAIKISASCCAQVSYRLLDQSIEKAIKIYDSLVESKPVHASPFEHQATPMVRTAWPQYCDPTTWLDVEEDGVTHADRQGNYWSGNLRGWIQNRQLIPDHTVW